jgi:arylsulfatase A-like enzyme
MFILLSKNFFQNKILLKITLISALLSGFLFAIYDLSFFILSNNIPLFNFWDFIKLTSLPFGFYILIALIIYPLFSIFNHFMFQLSGLEMSPKKEASLFFAFSVFLTTAKIIDSAIQQGANTRKISLPIAIVIASIIAFFCYQKLRKFFQKRSTTALGKLIFSFSGLLFTVWLFMVWFLYKADYPPIQKSELVDKINIEQKPNIILIILDTVRADHLSSYGYNRQTTPNIDTFSEQGVLYTNAISQAPWTLPSHASLLTGLYPRQHGADGRWLWLDNNFSTLPEILSDNGYYTIGISNNHNFHVNTNLHQGFDKFIYTKSYHYNSSNFFLTKVLKDFYALSKSEKIKNLISDITYFFSSKNINKDYGALFTNKVAKDYLNYLNNSKVPVFLMMNYMEAHTPLGETADKTLYLKDLNVSLREAKRLSVKVDSDLIKTFTGEWKLTEREIQIIHALYDADLHYLDERIGELINYLKDMNLFDNSMIIITSDHGENLGDHGILAHEYDIHRSLVHVPLIIYYPKFFQANSVIDNITETKDIFPTVLDIAGIQNLENGELLKYSLRNNFKRNFVLSENAIGDLFSTVKNTLVKNPTLDQRVITGEWLNIQNNELEFISNILGDKLYDITTDPNELNNVVDIYPQKTKEMKEKLNQRLREIGSYWFDYNH